MNKQEKIDFIVNNERFPLTKNDKIVLGIIATALITISIAFLTYSGLSILKLLLVLTIVGLLFYVVYKGMVTSLLFHKISTGFTRQENIKLILVSLTRLNINAYKDEKHNNVFVCFVHQRNAQREEIYIIAKEKKVLITSNKEKKEEKNNPFEIDFVQKIGGYIYQTAKGIVTNNRV